MPRMLECENSPSDAASISLPLKEAARMLDRIASWVGAYNMGTPEAYLQLLATEMGRSPELLFAICLLRLRRQREAFLGLDLFGEPAWDILLDLFVAHEEGVLVSTSSLCIAAAVPSSTAFRWIEKLTKKGVLIQNEDPSDGRRTWITLTNVYLDKMRQLLRAGIKQSLSPLPELGDQFRNLTAHHQL